jgi:hypothetical protein
VDGRYRLGESKRLMHMDVRPCLAVVVARAAVKGSLKSLQLFGFSDMSAVESRLGHCRKAEETLGLKL